MFLQTRAEWLRDGVSRACEYLLLKLFQRSFNGLSTVLRQSSYGRTRFPWPILHFSLCFVDFSRFVQGLGRV